MKLYEKTIGITAGIIAIFTFFYKIASHENGLKINIEQNNKRIERLEKNIKQLEKSVYKNTENLIKTNNKKIKYYSKEKASGFISLSNKRLNKKITSYGIVLDRSQKVCEVNMNCKVWKEKFGKIPYWKDFIEFEFDNTGKKSWALVIGRYKGNAELLNTSEVVFNELGVSKNETEFFAHVRIISEEEWMNDEEKVRLVKNIERRYKRR